MDIIKAKIGDIKPNPDNPRRFPKGKFDKLKRSIREFPEMMEIRPIVVNSEMIVLGGNMRLKACKELGLKEIPIIIADSLTFEKQREFVVKDNVSFGEWDFDMLADWNLADLETWGLEMKDSPETAKLSDLEFKDVYYTPEHIPELKLEMALNMDLFNSKVKFIEESNLNDKQKGVLKYFAYRFIRINFETVANYYAFNATDEEKKVIERLRLVLVDSGVQGFIEDHLLRISDGLDTFGDD